MRKPIASSLPFLCGLGVLGGHDVLQAANAAQMLASCDMIDMRNIFDVAGVVVDTEALMSADVDFNHPELATKKDSAASSASGRTTWRR